MKKNFLLLITISLLACNHKMTTGTSASGSNDYNADSKQIIVYTTAENTDFRLTPTDTLHFNDFGQPVETQIYIFVDPTKTFQNMMGIGGALTDAAAETFFKLPKDKQKELLTAYYSKDKDKGIGYTLARTNIGSCDFSSGSYTYIKEGDSALKTFSIDHDQQFKIPFIKDAMAAAGGKLTLFASPWSPPAFMKANDDLLHGGRLKPEYYHSWAMYFTKFIKAYQAEGIPIWGITIQNEPMAKQTWESCNYTADEERDFLKNDLGPVMKSQGLGDKKIIGWDHNRDLIYQWSSTLLSDPESAKYLWGIGFHWYETWTGGKPMYDNVGLVHEAFPNINLLFTEGSNELFDINKIHEWKLGERYGESMIHDFNNGSVGWTDWNILLDEHGGPNHVGNYCFAPIHANTQTGELIYTNSYYYIGQFSKFIHPGAKRIISSSSRSSLQTTAFRNEDGSVATVVLNEGDIKIDYFIWVNGKAAEVTSLPHSIQTLVF
ncbi:MAG TPA: glycoside hydrolase family 30 protein [Hanamia sp.]|nr:glycoside hydrolase family 30 protein [Hanamia sp.]